MLTTDAINDFKDFIDNIIAYAKVTVNGVSEKKVIHRRERLKDGRVAVYVQITPQVSGTATVQRVQLYNKNNKLWADKAVNIPLKNYNIPSNNRELQLPRPPERTFIKEPTFNA